jgi:SAM-dependent methyltransferase
MQEERTVNEKQLSESSDPGFSYFGVQAQWGITKHMGGLKATEELAELCHIGQDTSVLEIGCGVGMTTCHLAGRYGCRVVGVDISDRMIDWSRRRAKKKGLEDRLELIEIVARTHRVNALSQRIDEMRELDFQDTLDRPRAWGSFLSQYVRDGGFREYAREITPSTRVIKSLFAYLGYGIYVGRVPSQPTRG